MRGLYGVVWGMEFSRFSQPEDCPGAGFCILPLIFCTFVLFFLFPGYKLLSYHTIDTDFQKNRKAGERYMRYLMSDIHGDFENFYKMLVKINFSNYDQLYVLGDVLDKGTENLCLYEFIYHTENIYLLKGNHEYLCERYLSGQITAEMWDSCGGETTRREVSVLSEEKRQALYYSLRELPVYKVLQTGSTQYFLTHSGYHADCCVRDPESGLVDIEASVKKAVSWNQERYLFSDDIHYIPASLRFDKRLIVGHYPTLLLPDFRRAEIYHGTKYTNLDTGNERRDQGGRLACLRLEDGREFYV